MKYHYVYRITNIIQNLHYYGTRTSNIKPKEDIGFKYFSSSKNKEFIKDQKENTQDYKYKVIKIYKTRKEALELEIKLHNKFNVGVNENFYNKSKQTSTGWDTTGMTGDLCHRTGTKMSEETKQKLRDVNIGKTQPLEQKIKRILYKHTEEAKQKISKNHRDISGAKNPCVKRYIFISPKGEIFYVDYGVKNFCNEHNIQYSMFNTDTIIPLSKNGNATEKTKNTAGWQRIEVL